MRKLASCLAFIAVAMTISSCGLDGYDPQEGVTVVTSPTPTRGVISGFPTTVRPSSTRATITTTTVAPPTPAVTTIIVVPAPPVTTTTVAPPPPAPVRPAARTIATGTTLGRCGGTRLVMDMPINNVPYRFASDGLHFDGAPSIPIVSAIVQTSNPATDEFTGYVMPLTNSMIGTASGQALDFTIRAPEAAKAIVLCDASPR